MLLGVVINPILWLVLSFLLVSVSLTAVLVVLIPAVVELSRAARSFEKLCDTLDRDLPPTLDSIRQTTREITRLTDDVNAGVQNAGRVAQQVDQSVSSVRNQAQRAQVGTRSLMAGMGAAWATLTKPETPGDRSRHRNTTPHRPSARRPAQSPTKLTHSLAQSTSPTEPPPTQSKANMSPESADSHSDRASSSDSEQPLSNTTALDADSIPESRTFPELP